MTTLLVILLAVTLILLIRKDQLTDEAIDQLKTATRLLEAATKTLRERDER